MYRTTEGRCTNNLFNVKFSYLTNTLWKFALKNKLINGTLAFIHYTTCVSSKSAYRIHVRSFIWPQVTNINNGSIYSSCICRCDCYFPLICWGSFSKTSSTRLNYDIFSLVGFRVNEVVRTQKVWLYLLSRWMQLRQSNRMILYKSFQPHLKS